MPVSNTPQGGAPVIALTILDATTLGPDGSIRDDSRLLLGVRDPRTHATHPDVVSVPTQRIPPEVLAAIQARSQATLHPALDLPFPERLQEALILEAEGIDSRTTRGHDPFVYAVESLLSRKLGLAEALEQGAVSFTAFPGALLDGSVLYKDRGPEFEIPGEKVTLEGQVYFRERNAMVNVVVKLAGASAVPEKTSSYRALRWIGVADFLRLAATRDHKILFSLFGTDAFGLCIHGLCILSAYSFLKHGKR